MSLHIIYAGQRVLISCKPYGSWRDIQDDVADYTASLGPWTRLEVIEYLSAEYPALLPTAAGQVQSLINSGADNAVLTWRDAA